tara:strand:- start:2047 stop:2781 length:735 start_codon:yes stop_codon:yes gene_type:complete
MNYKPFNHINSSKKEQITTMFNRIASTYDRLNNLITFGMDNRWRKQVASIISKKHPKDVLDIATGTGAIAIDLANQTAAKIVGVDISKEMLDIGEKKIKSLSLEKQISMQLDDAEALSFNASNFDAVSVGFGVRNFEDLHQGLTEIYRVLKPGGLLVILETSVPKYFPFKQGYHFYSKWVIPSLGKIFSSDKLAYEYLSGSASVFPHGKDFNTILRENNFIDIIDSPKFFGIVSIYSATKPVDN